MVSLTVKYLLFLTLCLSLLSKPQNGGILTGGNMLVSHDRHDHHGRHGRHGPQGHHSYDNHQGQDGHHIFQLLLADSIAERTNLISLMCTW